MRHLLLFALLGCGVGDQGAATYVGSVEGTDIKVGIVTEGGKAAVFFCGGPGSYSHATKWFRGAAKNATSVSFADAGWVASASMDGETADGTVNPGTGSALRFTAKRVSESGVAGLYEAVDMTSAAGVVVLDEQTMQGAVLPKANAAINAQQIVPILPIARSGDTIRVKVNERELTVVRTRAR